jgi:hypothetical protein
VECRRQETQTRPADPRRHHQNSRKATEVPNIDKTSISLAHAKTTEDPSLRRSVYVA